MFTVAKLNKRKIILLMTMAVVLASLMISPMTATAAKSDAKSAAQIEKQIDKFLSKYGIEDSSDIDKLSEEQQSELSKMLLQHSKLEVKERELRPTVEDNKVTILSSSSKTRGSYTFYSANAGGADSGKSWFPVGIWDADYYTSSRKAESTVVVGPAGWGSAWAWSAVGQSFYFSGSSNFMCNFQMVGDYEGLLSCFAGGNASVEMNLVVLDTYTGATTTQVILDESTLIGGFSWEEYDSSFNKNLTTMIVPYYTYIVYLEINANAAVGGIGESGSDWGHHDHDGGYSRYSYITLTW